MRDVVDLHTHTLASGHAYNTINEMVQKAVEKKLEFFGITEHAPALPGTCTPMYFMNLRDLPRVRENITVLFGVELNIIDFDGHVDLPENTLAEMDVAVASMHTPCFRGGSEAENTRAYLNIMKNPHINIIGHPDDCRFPVDYRALVEGAKENHVLLEMNNSSLAPGSFRGNPVEIYEKMLELCVEYSQPIIVDSDAHVDLDVGNHELAMAIIERVKFPQELLVNACPELLQQYLNYYKRD